MPPPHSLPLTRCLQMCEEFKAVGYMHEKMTMMASEIDDKDSLATAHSLGYKTYGTGGFMGDSEKAWPVTESKFSASACSARTILLAFSSNDLRRYGREGCEGLR